MTLNWRKSSYSGGTGNCVEVAQADWRKSSRSGGQGNCVEVGQGWRKSSRSATNGECVEAGQTQGAVLVRDTKQYGRGQTQRFTAEAWRAFIAQIKVGEIDR